MDLTGSESSEQVFQIPVMVNENSKSPSGSAEKTVNSLQSPRQRRKIMVSYFIIDDYIFIFYIN